MHQDSSIVSKEAGYVDGGSIISFAAGIAGQAQADVLNSSLLAQLAANKKYDREKDTENWYKFYRSVLENVGWVVGSFEFQKSEVSGASASVDKVVLELLATIAIGNDTAILTKTLNAAKELANKNDSRITLFDSSCQSSTLGNFQIGLASEAGDVVSMRIGTLYFNKSKQVKNILFLTFSDSNSTIYKGSQIISLNKEVYGQVREQVVGKLGAKAKQFIADLEI